MNGVRTPQADSASWRLPRKSWKVRLSNIGAAPHPPAHELNRPTPTHASCPLAVCTSHMCPQTLPQTYQGTNPYHAPDRDIPQTERPSRLSETRGASDSGLRGSLRLLRHPDATHDARTTCVTRASTMACLRRPGALCMRACSTLTSRHNAHTAGRQRSLGAVNARHDALSGPAREHLPRPPRRSSRQRARGSHGADHLVSRRAAAEMQAVSSVSRNRSYRSLRTYFL